MPQRKRISRPTLPSAPVTLAELRELLGKTQLGMAAELEMDQSLLSRTERRGGHRVSTLRRYVEALGGELVISVRFGSRFVQLKGV
jgi:transcriptional regulator with XRE-family HTH domain